MHVKKIFIVLILFLSIMLSGCIFSYADTRKKDMDLVDVKVFDKDNNELNGEYIDYFHMDFLDTNSAAPVEYFYQVKVKEKESYTVKFYFTSIKGYKMEKLILSDEYGNNEIEVDKENITEEDKKIVVTFKASVDTSNIVLKIKAWYLQEEVRYFSLKGSNTYKKGVYLIVTGNEDVKCKA